MSYKQNYGKIYANLHKKNHNYCYEVKMERDRDELLSIGRGMGKTRMMQRKLYEKCDQFLINKGRDPYFLVALQLLESLQQCETEEEKSRLIDSFNK